MSKMESLRGTESKAPPIDKEVSHLIAVLNRQSEAIYALKSSDKEKTLTAEQKREQAALTQAKSAVFSFSLAVQAHEAHGLNLLPPNWTYQLVAIMHFCRLTLHETLRQPFLIFLEQTADLLFMKLRAKARPDSAGKFSHSGSLGDALVFANYIYALSRDSDKRTRGCSFLISRIDDIQKRFLFEGQSFDQVVADDFFRVMGEQSQGLERRACLKKIVAFCLKYDGNFIGKADASIGLVPLKAYFDLFIEGIDLPPHELRKRWKLQKRTRGVPAIIESLNTFRLIALEKKRRGICKTLLESFNIAHFVRYPEEVLLAQYDQYRDSTKPYIVLIAADDDHNGALTDVSKGGILKNLLADINGRSFLRIIEVASPLELTRLLLKLEQLYCPRVKKDVSAQNGHKIQDVIVETHASRSLLALGSEPEGALTQKGTTSPAFRKVLERFFEADATFIFNACEVAQPDGILATVSAEYPNFTFIGSNQKTSASAFHYSPRPQGEEMYHLDATYDQESSRVVYRGGKRLA